MDEWMMLTKDDSYRGGGWYYRELKGTLHPHRLHWMPTNHPPHPRETGASFFSTSELAAIPPVAALAGAARPFATQAGQLPLALGDDATVTITTTAGELRRVATALAALEADE